MRPAPAGTARSSGGSTFRIWSARCRLPRLCGSRIAGAGRTATSSDTGGRRAFGASAAAFGATAARTRRRTSTGGAPAVAGHWERRAPSDAAAGLAARAPGGARLRRAAWPCADRPARRVAERRAFRGGAAPRVLQYSEQVAIIEVHAAMRTPTTEATMTLTTIEHATCPECGAEDETRHRPTCRYAPPQDWTLRPVLAGGNAGGDLDHRGRPVIPGKWYLARVYDDTEEIVAGPWPDEARARRVAELVTSPRATVVLHP